MRLEYFLKGLNYPCTIEWYRGKIDDKHCLGDKTYTLTEINDVLDNFEVEHFMYEFKQVSSTYYKIAIF